MKIIYEQQKPQIDKTNALCHFRSSKSYIWGLIKQKLSSQVYQSNSRLNILDAACHSLITRKIFPDNCNYYGLDISKDRLNNSLSRVQPNDRLFLADLTAKFSISSCFDGIVSSNTLSHLPSEQQLLALTNLVSLCKVGGFLFVNAEVSTDSSNLLSVLLNSFESVEIIYADSYRSRQDELNSCVNESNVLSLITLNEESIPNVGVLHRQVIFFCYTKKDANESISVLPRSVDSRTIKVLSKLPRLHKTLFANDEKAVSSNLFNDVKAHVLMTSKLYASPEGQDLYRLLSNKNVTISLLTSSKIRENSRLYIFGLEQEWTDDSPNDRKYINALRSKAEFIHAIFVRIRGNKNSTFSTIYNDFS